ncbi:MAG: DASS family sodium-coupled anion symporter [Gilvibacter sp.]
MSSYPIFKRTGLIAGPVLFSLLLASPYELLSPEADKVVAVAIWMLVWWVSEAVSISVTALLPLVLFPLVGVMDIKEVSQSYGSSIIFLFFGGFVMALALEKVHLHKRIALNIIRITGTSPNRIILGFMLATALLSMWISNTASTLVMLPIGLSVIQLLIDDEDGFTKKDRNFALSIMLGIAYAANAGGIATIIGTPPNSVLIGFLENEYQTTISFVSWMVMGLPFSLIMLGLVYWILVYVVFPNRLGKFDASKELIATEIQKLGPISHLEKRVLWVFAIAILLWIFRSLLNKHISWLNISDTEISMYAALALFAIPHSLKKGGFILNWSDTSRLAWGILILFGGGLALASGLSQTGVIDAIAAMITGIDGVSLFVISALIITVVLFMTEMMSNVALVAIFAPVVAGIALGLNIPMLHLLIPVAMASSCAFMLPMATPPNAIVFASGYIKIKDMVRAGILLNFFAILLLLLFYSFVIPLLF